VTSPDRAFACFDRGELRDLCLASFRYGLRSQRNPETGALFTEDEIAQATQRGGRWWIEADGLDVVLMAIQGRAIWLAQQMRPERAADSFLYGFHGDLWGQTPLEARGGSGTVLALATPGTIFVGSTTIPDPAAHTARDNETGLRFQVLVTTTTDGTGQATPTLIGIDTGEQTNLAYGSVLTWENPPLGAEPTVTVTASPKFRGGRSRETSKDFADRLRDNIRHKAAAGNRAHFRAWARENVNVLDAYVYPCALHAGTVLVCLTQQRGEAIGPNALVADSSVLSLLTAYLVPPGSTVVPERAFVHVCTFTPEACEVVLRLQMPQGNDAGWRDATPWPQYAEGSSSNAKVYTITDSTHFTIKASTAPPSSQPKLMAWDVATSRWTELAVASVTLSGSDVYDVVLSSPASIQSNQAVCAAHGRHSTLSQAIEAYFDSVGPGEVVNLSGDVRSDRAARFPSQQEEATAGVGTTIVSFLEDAFGASLMNAMPEFSVLTPALPTTPIAGPHKLTLGRLRVFPI
jgi:hypothetical protein